MGGIGAAYHHYFLRGFFKLLFCYSIHYLIYDEPVCVPSARRLVMYLNYLEVIYIYNCSYYFSFNREGNNESVLGTQGIRQEWQDNERKTPHDYLSMYVRGLKHGWGILPQYIERIIPISGSDSDCGFNK